MTIAVRDSKFDVVIVAGHRVEPWPTVGARALSQLCGSMGLKVGVFGGETMHCRGVIPLPGAGGLVIVEDAQKRVHRYRARAVVRICSQPWMPDPFEGWRSPGLIPISTAIKLRADARIHWEPCTVVLGTGNRALRFASELLESGTPRVICLETDSRWNAKRYAGWEVERRRFEVAGGQVLEGEPVALRSKGPMLWELQFKSKGELQTLEVGRVVSAGPFRELPGVREYPAGSLLFEFEQSAGSAPSADVEGWQLEEARGRWLAGRIVKGLSSDRGEGRQDFDSTVGRARARLKRMFRHREEPFMPGYQGKWVAAADAKRMKSFHGVPQSAHKERQVASIECFEDISCTACRDACPEKAIQFFPLPRSEFQLLLEDRCNGCGACVSACPSAAISMLHEKENQPTSTLTLPWRGLRPWAQGEFAALLNRRGEVLANGRVSKVHGDARVEMEVPTHLVWEARGLKRVKSDAAEDKHYLQSEARAQKLAERVEILLDGNKRLVPDKISVNSALFEIGQSRPEDVLACTDGSCGLCEIEVDGIRKQACAAQVHKGMSIRLRPPRQVTPPPGITPGVVLCSCMGVTREYVLERIRQGKLSSPEAVLAATHVGEGKCRGQLCIEALRRVMIDEGIDASQWIDWRFPMGEWKLFA